MDDDEDDDEDESILIDISRSQPINIYQRLHSKLAAPTGE